MAVANDRWDSHRGYLKQALDFKAEGNTFYKAKEFKKAIRKYHRALLLLKAVGLTVGAEFQLQSQSLPQEMIEERDRLMSECYNNLAACLLTRQDPDYQRIVEHCGKVLEHDSGNVKAAYRMGTALRQLGRLDRAREVVTGQPHFLSDKTMQVLLKSIQEKEKVEDEKLKVTYQRMFQSNLKKEEGKGREARGEPILIRSGVCGSEGKGQTGAGSTRREGDGHNGPKLIHVASAEKEAAC